MRIYEDANIRSKLAACLPRDLTWESEMHNATCDILEFVREAYSQPLLSSQAVNTMRGEYLVSTAELKEITENCLASRSILSTVEQQLVAWKGACRVIINQNRDKGISLRG